MKREFYVALCFSLLLGGCAQSTKTLNVVPKNETEVIEIETNEEVIPVFSSEYQTLATALDTYLVDESFNGVSLIASGDEIILFNSYGLANVENQEPLTVDHQFQIASVSKSFVAVSILQLVEARKLTLDQTIDKYFPHMPNAKEITIHQLLTHTSGLYSGDDLTNYSEVTSVEEIISPAFQPSNLYYEEPGTYSIYSNLGYDVLGAIVEQVSGMPYETYLEENILIPADMTQSGLNIEGNALEKLATAYNGNIEENYEAKVLHPSFGYSSGGLHSTAMDLYKYDRALKSNSLISQQSYDLMTQAYTKVGRKDYGYGWYIDTGVENTISHTGNLIGWHSMLLRHQEDKVTVILLTNHDESDMFMAYNLARLVLSEVNE
ncbi:MAG: beta-lactamase family protein [Turicibacter sp.]|nr:beta-lactamase family protein [Turicibacter sp.]